MEQSISSLAFRGSIAEAILESKNQRKLFVVYISGDDSETSSLESSTWTSSRVTESVSKYCVLLHIPAGSTDAAQFSSIYPQKSVPCITAVGYNGIQLWQNEGFIGAEVLASNLEKAWLGLHIQETTASVLTAALASKKSEASTSSPPDSSSSHLGSSSLAAVSPADHRIDSSDTNLGVSSDIVEEEKGPEKLVKEDIKVDVKEYNVNHSERAGNNDESPNLYQKDKSSLADPGDQKNGSSEHTSNTVHDSSIVPKLIESCQASQPISLEAKEETVQEKNEIVDENNAIENDSGPKDYMSSDVNLNIRLLNGVNLREKFSKTSSLRMVKDYVDNNQESTFGSFDLAIPYPRRVFTDQDLGKSLSDLGLHNRQALIIVRHQGVSSDFRGASSSSDQRNFAANANGISSDENGDGYFAFVKRVLSYANPFSYLGGGASTASSRHETQGDMRQYSSESSEAERRYVRQPNQGTATTGGNNTKGKLTSRFGANIHSIHTLKNDDDDESKGRNTFWNGNSTEYGGNSDSK